MSAEDFYTSAEYYLEAILNNLVQIQIVTQGVLILLCGICIYHLFWGRK